MARTLDAVISGLPLDQQREIEARAAQLIEEEMTLSDLRKARELTQKRVAEALNISQDGVSRIEARSDFLLSTLGAYVEALGGQTAACRRVSPSTPRHYFRPRKPRPGANAAAARPQGRAEAGRVTQAILSCAPARSGQVSLRHRRNGAGQMAE
jgi:predicted XRE-type DNA-binding protein